MSSLSTSRAKKMDPLSKKIPQNPKYKHVRSGIDTGASITKYMQKLEDIKTNYRFRKDEIFKRMKITTFVQLVCQVYQIHQDNGFDFKPSSPFTDRPDTADAEVAKMSGDSPIPSLTLTDGDFGAQSIPDSSRSTLLRPESGVASVARGMGELDIHQPEPAPGEVLDDNIPYLLLDVRDDDDFNMCHIISAKHYPKSYLSRAANYESKDMLLYKNKPGKIIIIYDEQERAAPDVAQTLEQRGYNNLFMLSGGLKVAYKVFPEGLFTGTVPPSLSGFKAKHQLPASQVAFEQDDIDRLDMYLDNHLQDHSVGSRLSKASTASSRVSTKSSMTARSSLSQSSSVTDRPAFR